MIFPRPPKIVSLTTLTVIALDAFILIYGPRTTLDRRFYYSDLSARVLLEALGTAGRHRYAITECVDLFLIAAYTSLLVILFRRKVPRFLWLAVMPGVFDAYETLTILSVLIGITPTDALDGLGWITAAKWGSGAGAMLALLVPLLRTRSGPAGSIHKR